MQLLGRWKYLGFFKFHFKNTKCGVQVIHLPVCGWVCPNVSIREKCYFYCYNRTSLIQRPCSLLKRTDFPSRVLWEQHSANVWDVILPGFRDAFTVAFWNVNVNDRTTFKKWEVYCILHYTFFIQSLCAYLLISCNWSPWHGCILVRFYWMEEPHLFSCGTIFTNMINAIYCLKSELEYLQHTFLS